MGLDWNPGNRPKPGFEAEFRRLFAELTSKAGGADKEALKSRFFQISTSAYETLDAPRVGHDPRANAWIEAKHAETNPPTPLSEWVERFQGFYVVPLVPPCDGIPRYSNGQPGGYVEPFSFRAQFLVDCEEIIGAPLLEAAYESKLAEDLATYGSSLLTRVEHFALEKAIGLPPPESDDPESAEVRTDVVYRAGLWCRFWAERGHTLDAYW
jgi:hypothetical protein